MRYCVKCFDNNDICCISLVTDSDHLFEVCEDFRKDYKVKAYLLTEESEVK